MRLTLLLIFKSFIICNILIFASVARGNKTSEAAALAANNNSNEAENKDKHPSEFNNINSIRYLASRQPLQPQPPPQPPPPPLLLPTPQQQQASPQPIIATTTITQTTTPVTSNPNIVTATLTPNSSLPISSTQLSSTKTDKKICKGVHIRNDLKSFEQLRGCVIIEGPLTIGLIKNDTHPFEARNYENITFPHLVEVTEYVIFFRVQGLTTLSKLFPNLAVIRGRELISNYALIIYEMMHLHKIDLLKLSDILRGSVRIESNPNLCYASTVNWGGICKSVFTPHFIRNNNAHCDNRCPEYCRPWDLKLNPEPNRLQGDVKELGSENNRSIFCWNSQTCHELCQSPDGMGIPIGPNGNCCAAQCAGGCTIEGRSDSCISCRSVLQERKCVDRCGPTLYEYKGECITYDKCILMNEKVMQYDCGKTASTSSISNFKPIKGRCQVSCPANYEEDPSNEHNCKLCDKEKCRKVCTPPANDKSFMVTNVHSLRELTGCNVINGSLEISIKGGKNVIPELKTAFQELEEIKGYLKITRSYPIVTLEFLKSLRLINGTDVDRSSYSLLIIDNPNLQELFTFNKSDSEQKQLRILNGTIFAHLNPKLCLQRITDLKSYASIADWDAEDVSLYTNGDKEACEAEKIEVIYKASASNSAMIEFRNVQEEDRRSILYYLINYREAPNGNVTMFDGRDGCNSQNDLWATKEIAPATPTSHKLNESNATNLSTKRDESQTVIITVKPATRYALYIKTFTIAGGSKGALSEIIYFETDPDTPGIPKEIESFPHNVGAVQVSWLPPSKPNGIIDSYLITITRVPEEEDFQTMDTCDSIENRDKITQSLTRDEPSRSALISANSENEINTSDNLRPNLPTCVQANPDADADIHAESVSFQDIIIDMVYKKNPCAHANAKNSSRRKRSTDSDYDASQIHDQERIPDNARTETNNRTAILPHIKFDRSKDKTVKKITVERVKSMAKQIHIIDNLDHYTKYQIEIVACHGDYVNVTRTGYNKCSLQAITQVRSDPIADYDKVLNTTIKLKPANESSSENIVTWEKPKQPNGLVLAYRVRYRPKNGPSELWTEGCINSTAFDRNRGFVLSNINPGSYWLSVQALSMYSGQRSWSEPFDFEIPQNNFISPGLLVFLMIAGLLLILMAVASGTYYFQKKRNELANGLVYASVNPEYMQYTPDEWEVKKDDVKIEGRIGDGAFGMVYKGQLVTERGTLNCAIKTLLATATSKQRMDFLREASIMKKFDTFHIVKLMGVVSTTNPVYVIMEYMKHGDLKKFIFEQREKYKQEGKLLVDGIYLMAAQIADGMAYLASKKYVHRDLAARNCMVGENQVVKIGDFGLTRDTYVKNYYRRDTHDRLPVRWMAPECLKDNLYTSASDVWSFGIVVWEIVTFGEYPYQGLSNEEVVRKVMHGLTLSRPENCPDKLYSIMERCWKQNYRERPTFNDIVEYLLPLTEGKLYPNCFYRRQKTEGDSIAQPIPEENNAGAESYPLLTWPENRANGLANGRHT